VPGFFYVSPPLRIDAESQASLIRDMTTYIISEAKPKLGALVRQAAAGKTIYLLNGKDMVALVPARPTHEAAVGLEVAAVNRRLAASERTPTAPWNPGDAGRLVKQVLRPKTIR
jgi:antitoxin (DNA-binding transcriptional repressor) of toxin-antitoxin stability system